MTSDQPAATQDEPAVIGPYRILSLLGEGGMGTVYVAEQFEPVRRRVAVKVVKLGMDSKRVLARFEAERQALAMMSHPHIAKVLDAGTTGRGQPYFVMDLVKGIPITDYCNRNRLGIQERVKLMQQVCGGVQHAHHKGIIHRDLKPSNILVEIQDDKPIARIIDFGQARATDHHLTAHTIFTEQGQILGTPEYMSPEQAEMTGVDIDTRTDVYSLGVLLYEVLTGEQPFAGAELRKSGPLEMQRILREQTPPIPSARVRQTGATTGSAESRSTTVLGLERMLRRELDWIVMRALEKDRTRRYQSPAELAADLERYLHGEPVLAGPPSAMYRVAKFLRRHRGAVVASALVLVSLLAGLLTSSVLYLQATSSERRAREQEANAERRARSLEALADHHRLRELVPEMDQLWPEVPELLPRMQDWMARAESLARKAEAYQQRLRDLRHKGRERSIAEARATQEDLPLARELARIERETEELRRQRDAAGGGTQDDRVAILTGQIDVSEARTAELRREVPAPRLYQLEDAEDQLQHDALEDLLAELEPFCRPRTGNIDAVQKRMDFASSVRRLTIETQQAAWADAIRAVAAATPYRQVPKLTPQLGLVPLGVDPRSGLWEFGHPRSGQLPVRNPASGALQMVETCCIVFVLLPGGRTLVGAQRDPAQPNYDPEAELNEKPAEARLRPFFMAKHEMTQHQWLQLAGDNPSRFRPGKVLGSLLHPVERVDALACDRVLRHHGLLLPTDAQWEYACRAGTDSVWFTGNDPESLAGSVNLADISAASLGWPAIQSWLDDGHQFHAPVDTYKPNLFGLHNMAGNVWEWCRDALEDGPTRRLRDGDGENLMPGANRLVRGGAYDKSPKEARSAKRTGVPPGSRFDNVGLRPIRVLDG